jgi:hypothetical protein
MTESSRPSQRALEVARDLFDQLTGLLRGEGREGTELIFHLDSTDRLLSRTEAEQWILESVDSGYPDVRYYLEKFGQDRVVVNLAAFQDPDYQHHV